MTLGCRVPWHHPPPAAVPPEIVPVEGASLDHTPGLHLPLRGRGGDDPGSRIDPAVYAGAKEADRRLHLYEDLSEEEWIPIYYQAFANDSHQEPFYANLIAAFREIRDREGLDDDRYLELITVFVQSIPYRTDDSITEPKFPIETYGDGEGDCDDKSLLLAGLLAREGYQVALFYFGDEAHMAVGVGGAGCHYQNTPLAYIETTNASYVGIPPPVLSNGTVLASDPLVIPVGDGPRYYAACDQVMTIERALSVSRARVEALAPELGMRAGELEAEKEYIESLGARMAPSPGRGRSGNTTASSLNITGKPGITTMRCDPTTPCSRSHGPLSTSTTTSSPTPTTVPGPISVPGPTWKE
jgi:hypothetical protein